MVVAEEQDSRTIELGALAWIVKARWDRDLDTSLKIRVHRIMPGPDGEPMQADIALQDTKTHKPRVIFEMIDD